MDDELIVLQRFYLECRRCGWRSQSLLSHEDAVRAKGQHQHRTECQECHAPYDEDSDNWGLCARCWTAYIERP